MRYGSGSTFRRSDGKWVALWERPREDGKRRRGSRVGDTEAAAIRKMREAQRGEGRSSSRSRGSTESVGAFLDRWLADVVRHSRRERTAVGYRAILVRLPLAIRDTGLSDPRLPHALNAWLSGLDRHPRTIQHYAACLRTAFGYAKHRGLVDVNPALSLDLPAIPRVERIPLTTDQLRAFLGRGDPWHPLWTVAAWTGMRQGELLGLRWQDVDLERASLVVRHSMTRLPGKRGVRYVLSEPKTERSRRTIPLLPEVVAALRSVRKAQMDNPGKLDQGLVFCTAAGSPLDAADVSKRFVLAVTAAGLPRVTMHSLRHGFASYLIQQGVDLATIGAILGHSNIGTTVDIYGHLTETHKRAAVQRLVEVTA